MNKYCPYTFDSPPVCEICTHKKCERKKRERELDEWIKPFIDKLNNNLKGAL